MNAKPNIVFFFTDDQRFDTIAALGNKEVITPNMDGLVGNGTSFTCAHIAGGTIGAVCMPSRAMLHTGRTLFHLEEHGKSIPDEHVLLGEALREAGYRTFGTGKWHNGAKSYARSFTDGGEIYFGGMWDHWNVPAYNFDPTGAYDKTTKIVLNPFYSNKVSNVNSDHMQPGVHSSELFADKAVSWLNDYQADDPFFMYISFMAPHDPRTMPEQFLNMYDPEKIEVPTSYMDEHPFDYGVRDVRDEVLAPYPRTRLLVQQHIAEYYGMISHLDHQIGKVIQTLKARGQYENTIFIFAGDNGLALGKHGLFGKQNNYEHSVRVPLLFAGPGIPKNERRETYVYLLDIYPTICDMIGLPIPDSVEGVSLVQAIMNDQTTVRPTLYLAYADLLRSVKNDRYKLIEYRSEKIIKTQLFDLNQDPDELHDLSDVSAYGAIMEDLRQELLRYRADWNDDQHPTGKKFWGRYDRSLQEAGGTAI
jgi:arylsulfatase A-like enzyme